jgi:hypothetical protein
MAATISSALHPVIFGTGVSAAVPVAWQPEQAAAPGGASAALAVCGPSSNANVSGPGAAFIRFLHCAKRRPWDVRH